ncbi:MAG: DNA alkylation repair protein [Synergistaceae bacterium]|jgi:3-methyladenine DNA glycosylase AlkD|nr:DNA alkylation repair protein [Synergistaceae bacterium]
MGFQTKEIIDRLNEMAGADDSVKEIKLGHLDIFGIRDLLFLDIPHEKLLAIADEIGRPRQDIANELWRADQYEAKILSCMLSDPAGITEEQADELAGNFDSWFLCDYYCNKILWKMPFAVRKASEWADSENDKLLCSGFSLIAAIALHAPHGRDCQPGFYDNALFLARKRASSKNPHVRRAVSSALAMIGRIDADWNEASVETAGEIAAQPSEKARWVASQALADLKSSRVKNAFRRERP